MAPSINVRAFAEWTVVSVDGELDIATAPPLRTRLVDLIGAGHRLLVIDMSDVTFIDSTALGVLVGALKRVRGSDGEVRVVAITDPVLRTLRMTGLHRIFGPYGSVEDAVAGVRTDGPLAST